jgi:hypothetical protein
MVPLVAYCKRRASIIKIKVDKLIKRDTARPALSLSPYFAAASSVSNAS